VRRTGLLKPVPSRQPLPGEVFEVPSRRAPPQSYSPAPNLAGIKIPEAVLLHFELLRIPISLALSQPAIRDCDVDSLREAHAYLRSLGVPNIDAVAAYLPLAFQRPEALRAVGDPLRAAGVDVPKVLSAIPDLFDRPPAEVEELLQLLRDIGVDPAAIINAAPHVIGTPVGRVRQRVDFLRGLGVPVDGVVGPVPAALTRSLGELQRVVAQLSEAGLAAGPVVAASPTVLVENFEEAIVPRLRYLVKKIGGVVTDINEYPAYLGHPLRSRIRARFEYLKKLGREGPFSLEQVLAPDEHDFLLLVARCSPAEYMVWRSKRSWLEEPVPPRLPRKRPRY